jgi:glycosyltransferase involved in cell wall biosynthesis
MRMALKHVLLEQRQLRREVAQLRAGDVTDADKVAEYRYGPRDVEPRVSVLITVYNYELAVGEALRSVAAGTYGAYEVVIVDDASHDGSVAAVQQALSELPWVPARHLVRSRNAGLAAARNLAAANARGEYLFVLDADNSIFPHALERLVAALDADPSAAVAYGILQQVSGDGTVKDLMSWLGWDPLRLRFGNYIDAMAMIRRSALASVGGYTSDFRLYGWEDFALWCAFADRGYRGVRVPEILGRYVSAAHSMISITNIDASEAYAALGRAYPFMAGAELSGPATATSPAAAVPSAAS